MSNFIRTTGIVIGKRDFLEADKIITVVTPDLGKIEIKAKGARKMLAKMNSHLELFNHTDLTLVQGKTFYVVTGAQTIDSFAAMKQDIEWMGFAYYAAELLQGTLQANDEAHDVFRILHSFLQSSSPEAAPVATVFFEAQLWGILGLRPQFQRCVVCQGGLDPDKVAYSPHRGGTVCERHIHDGADMAWSIRSDTLKYLRLLFGCDWETVCKVRCSSEILLEVRGVFDRLAEYHVPRKIKARSFMGELHVGSLT